MPGIIRALLLACVAGVVAGLLMALDPLLPVLNITAPKWVWAILTPSVLIFRVLILFGPIALLSGGIAGYQATKRNPQRRFDLFASGLTGISLLIANIVFFCTLLLLLLQHEGLRHLINARSNQFLTTLGVTSAGTGQSASLSPAVLVIVGIVVGAFGLFNLFVALASGACGCWLALQQHKSQAGRIDTQ